MTDLRKIFFNNLLNCITSLCEARLKDDIRETYYTLENTLAVGLIFNDNILEQDNYDLMKDIIIQQIQSSVPKFNSFDKNLLPYMFASIERKLKFGHYSNIIMKECQLALKNYNFLSSTLSSKSYSSSSLIEFSKEVLIKNKAMFHKSLLCYLNSKFKCIDDAIRFVLEKEKSSQAEVSYFYSDFMFADNSCEFIEIKI